MEHAGKELASLAHLAELQDGATRAVDPTALFVNFRALVFFYGEAPQRFKVDGREYDATSLRDVVFRAISKDNLMLVVLSSTA